MKLHKVFLSACLAGGMGAFVAFGASTMEAYRFHEFEGYKPDPKMEVVTDPGVPGDVLRISGIKGWYGTALCRKELIKARPGDALAFVTMLVRGEGGVTLWTECYGEKGHIGRSSATVEDVIGDGWHFVEFRHPILNGTTSFQLCFGRRKCNNDIEFADVRIETMPVLPTRELTPTTVAYREDFETDSKRPGNPERVDGILAEGLGERTYYGLYRAAAPLEMFRTAASPGRGEVVSSTFRLYGFGEEAFGDVGRGRLVETVSTGEASISLEVSADPTRVVVEGRVAGADGEPRFRVPVKALPADFRLDVAEDGGWFLTVTSLADSSKRMFSGTSAALGAAKGPRTVAMRLPDGGTKVLLDRLEVVTAKFTERPARPPFRIARLPEFDPVKAGWREVMRDGFEGTELNTNIWQRPHWKGLRPDAARLDGEGHLRIGYEYSEKAGKFVSTGVWSRRKFLWGYYEARLKFTRKPGWNMGYWMYGTRNANPFLDGHEIDIVEDYYTRSSNPGGPYRLDHNNHFVFGSVLKSWNYNFYLPGSLDEWHVLGCLRTPFETTYYLDGKVMKTSAYHSPWDTLTFDPFNHMAGTRPLHVIFSAGVKDDKILPKGNDKEDFVVDWVRAYEMPDFDKAPAVDWRKPSSTVLVEPGRELSFEVVATPGEDGSKVEAVYLFDSGNFIDYRMSAEAKFAFPFSKGYFDGTDYMKPGRSGVKPPFDGSAHVFIAFAQDDKGRVGYTDKLIRIPVALRSAPDAGGPQAVPGTLVAKRHDVGGSSVSYFLRPGFREPFSVITPKFDNNGKLLTPLVASDWMNFSVDVASAGDYDVSVDAAFTDEDEPWATWLVDGDAVYSGPVTSARLRLPAGRRVLTIVSEGAFQFSKATLARK